MGQTLNGTSALIIGASTGMGRATALTFAKAGAKVAVSARNKEALNSLKDEIIASGGVCVATPADVQDRAQVKSVFAQAIEAFGAIDVVVYAAGTNVPKRGIQELSESDWRLLIDTNLTGAFHSTQEAIAAMLPRGTGLVIYISSVSAKRQDLSGAAYQASKHGIEGIVGAARQELRDHSLRFSVLYPGLCDTPLVDRRPTPPTDDERKLALKPQDIADACLYIASAPPHVYVKELVIDTTHTFW